MLTGQILHPQILVNTAVLYWGSVIQSAPACSQALLDFVDQAPVFTLKVYDPNYRAVLWDSLAQAKVAMAESFRRAHVVKLSDDEIFLLKRTYDYETAARELIVEYGIRLLIVTMGAQGSMYVTARQSGRISPLAVDSVEMTGAGDGFVAGLIRGLYGQMPDAPDPVTLLENLQPAQLEHILFEANAVGALATTKPGAMASLPTLAELDSFLQSAVLRPV
jgi:sugar/nucleoside kinase (ribokinase family)